MPQAMNHAKTLLRRKDQSFANVVAVLQGKSSILICASELTFVEFRSNIGDDPAEGDEGEVAAPPIQALILEQLIAFLEGIE